MLCTKLVGIKISENLNDQKDQNENTWRLQRSGKNFDKESSGELKPSTAWIEERKNDQESHSSTEHRQILFQVASKCIRNKYATNISTINKMEKHQNVHFFNATI